MQAQRQARVQQAQVTYQQQAQIAQTRGVAVPPFQPPQFPPLPALPTAFPSLPNATEIPIATAIVKRLSELMLDPRFSQKPAPWQQTVTTVYTQARSAEIPPPPPAQVKISGLAADAPTLEAEEAASKAGWGQQPPPPNNAVAAKQSGEPQLQIAAMKQQHGPTVPRLLP